MNTNTKNELAAAAKLLNIKSSADGIVVSERVIGYALALVQGHVQQAKGGRQARITTLDTTYRLSKKGWVDSAKNPAWTDLEDALNWVINASQSITTLVCVENWGDVEANYVYWAQAL